jgi:hypothetical protein
MAASANDDHVVGFLEVRLPTEVRVVGVLPRQGVFQECERHFNAPAMASGFISRIQGQLSPCNHAPDCSQSARNFPGVQVSGHLNFGDLPVFIAVHCIISAFSVANAGSSS